MGVNDEEVGLDGVGAGAGYGPAGDDPEALMPMAHYKYEMKERKLVRREGIQRATHHAQYTNNLWILSDPCKFYGEHAICHRG